jgi:xylan 1,4-beta-xylosidase
VNTLFYNTQHSPIGAFASFTLGARGAKGGLAIELGKPADQNVFIGLEDKTGGTFSCLPFFDAVVDESIRFDVEASGERKRSVLQACKDKAITRTLSPQQDTWEAGDLRFSIYSPVCPAPEPGAPRARQMLAYAPALAVEMTVDNRRGKKSRRAFFGYQGNDPYRGMRRLDDTAGGKFTGIACGETTAIASKTPGVFSAQGFTVEAILEEKHALNHAFGLGGVALLVGSVPAGKIKTFQFVVCFHRAGVVTTGMKARYYYSKYFGDVEAVADYALQNFRALKARGDQFEKRFQRSKLNPSRQFMLAQAIHSYFGSTELLDVEGTPMWIVNEGEYRMMNTFDLTADHLFFEMEFNPWTVANELDWFVRRYSYTDTLRLPNDGKEYPGGLSFTHDMGVANHFSRPGWSAYEKTGLHGCFSHMTHEELINWLVCGLIYERQTEDLRWLRRTLPVFRRALESLLRRDHPDPAQRDGIMSLDSSRCSGGGEITTYDSLDVSLGQARNNLYLAVKCWGVYVGLADLFRRLKKKDLASVCEDQARRVATTIEAAATPEGFLPAVLHENVESRIIPAIEGLIIPHCLGLRTALLPTGLYGGLIGKLKTHLKAVLQPGICLFPDGGWKISSTSENSWLSKVYLCQFVAETILGIKPSAEADKAHAAWLLDEKNHYWAWSDQILAGKAIGSKYYPRGVTAILWLREKKTSRAA